MLMEVFLFKGDYMKHKILILSIILFLLPVNIFSGEWTVQSPLPTGNDLLGVWGSSSGDVFAVGRGGTILHFNGSIWSSMSSGMTYDLCAVWGSSAQDVFTVGNDATGQGIIRHYNGNN